MSNFRLRVEVVAANPSIFRYAPWRYLIGAAMRWLSQRGGPMVIQPAAGRLIEGSGESSRGLIRVFALVNMLGHSAKVRSAVSIRRVYPNSRLSNWYSNVPLSLAER